jgi:hypothetical protein
MARRIARIALIGTILLGLLMTSAMVWLKIHEDGLVFAAAHSRGDTITPYSEAHEQ